MPNTCCVAGCTNRASKMSNKRFFRVPADPKRKMKWIVALNRKNWLPNKYSRLCSDHFVCGQPNLDPAHPDYVPCIFKEEDRIKAERRLERYERAKQLRHKRSSHTNNMDIVYILLEFSKAPRISAELRSPTSIDQKQ